MFNCIAKCSLAGLLAFSLSGCAGHKPVAQRKPSGEELDAVRSRAADAVKAVDAETKSGTGKTE